ncbi:MAG: SDR family NAD(P)-dependent oxidoreductase [Pseudomonadota bacterium]
MNLFDLSDMRIAITGAGGGIGAATARVVVAQGAAVEVTDLESPHGLAAELSALGARASARAVDVTSREGVEAWVSGSQPFDALIDCAAICPFDDWLNPDWEDSRDAVFRINLGGPLNLVRAFMPGMIERGRGRIALVGSVAGRIGGVAASAHYAMSKGGVHSFVRWASKRGAAHNVTVNAIAPGVVDTPMTANQAFDYDQMPMGRKASAGEIAGPLAFLVSPAAAYVNGAVLDVNSGMHFS